MAESPHPKRFLCFQLALYVLTFLAPRDLLQAAQTCRYWRILAEDNLLWREKCREEGKQCLIWSSGVETPAGLILGPQVHMSGV